MELFGKVFFFFFNKTFNELLFIVSFSVKLHFPPSAGNGTWGLVLLEKHSTTELDAPSPFKMFLL